MGRPYVAIFGAPFIRPAGGQPVAIGALQEVTFLTLLVSDKEGWVELDRLADELWGDNRPATWRQVINVLASNLRRAADDPQFATFNELGYRLHADPDSVDTDLEEIHTVISETRRRLDAGDLVPAKELAQRAVRLFGNGPRTTDHWGYLSMGAKALHLWAQAMLALDRPLECATRLNARVREQFDWDGDLWTDLVEAWLAVPNRREALKAVMGAANSLPKDDPTFAKLRDRFRARDAA